MERGGQPFDVALYSTRMRMRNDKNLCWVRCTLATPPLVAACRWCAPADAREYHSSLAAVAVAPLTPIAISRPPRRNQCVRASRATDGQVASIRTHDFWSRGAASSYCCCCYCCYAGNTVTAAGTARFNIITS